MYVPDGTRQNILPSAYLEGLEGQELVEENGRFICRGNTNFCQQKDIISVNITECNFQMKNIVYAMFD